MRRIGRIFTDRETAFVQFSAFVPSWLIICLSGLFLSACTNSQGNTNFINDTIPVFKDSIYTPYSTDTNTYVGFNSVNAINAIAKIENEYFNDYKKGVSKYHGTTWYELCLMVDSSNQTHNWNRYLNELKEKNLKPDSFHCTIYAVRALQAGFGDNFEKLQKLHKKHWGKREYAGWSIGYLLVKYFNWKAYLIIDEISPEYKRCIGNFKRNKTYYVWRQPDIKIEKLFIVGKDNNQIDSLLKQNEFGWGFSNQGIHTWITRYTQLKECRWEGAPGKDYDFYNGCCPLFKKYNFLDYMDYYSHVVIFPPKIKD